MRTGAQSVRKATAGVAEKQTADTYEKAVAVEGSENATGNSSVVRRFFGV